MIKPELEPAWRNDGATVRPPIGAPAPRDSEAGAIMPTAIGPGISASITPTVTPSAPTIAPTAFTPVRPVYSDSVYLFRGGHLLIRGLRKHFSYFRNPFTDPCIVAGPGTDRARFRI